MLTLIYSFSREFLRFLLPRSVQDVMIQNLGPQRVTSLLKENGHWAGAQKNDEHESI